MHLVAKAATELWTEQARGVRISALVERVGVEGTPAGPECIRQALIDLEDMGLIESGHSTIGPDGGLWQFTQRGEVLRDEPLTAGWAGLFSEYLTDEQLGFLRAAILLSEEQGTSMARVRSVQGADVAQGRGQDWSSPDVVVTTFRMVKRLTELGLLRSRPSSGGYLPLEPTYLGIVRATKQEPTQAREELLREIAERESSNVDFKREIALGSPSANAELVRDVLGMANALFSGTRAIVVGLNDDGSEYADAPDGLTQERVEQIVQSWAPPAPPLKLTRVRLGSFEVARIEIRRRDEELPYISSRSQGRLKAGVVYSRHGTHTEPATPDEERDIRARGDAARQAAGTR